MLLASLPKSFIAAVWEMIYFLERGSSDAAAGVSLSFCVVSREEEPRSLL